MNKRKFSSAFTLIEILIVIAIIGILTSIVLMSTSMILTNTKHARAVSELDQLSKVIQQAQIYGNQTLLQMDHNACSECVCRTSTDLRNIPVTDPCYDNWRIVLMGGTSREDGLPVVGLSARLNTDLSGFLRDPWGSPYLVDENEGEFGDPATDIVNYCRKDFIISAGPDGLRPSADDIDSRYFAGANIPFTNSVCDSH